MKGGAAASNGVYYSRHPLPEKVPWSGLVDRSRDYPTSAMLALRKTLPVAARPRHMHAAPSGEEFDIDAAEEKRMDEDSQIGTGTRSPGSSSTDSTSVTPPKKKRKAQSQIATVTARKARKSGP